MALPKESVKPDPYKTGYPDLLAILLEEALYISSSNDDDDTPAPTVTSITVVLPTMNLRAPLSPSSPSPPTHAAGASPTLHPRLHPDAVGRNRFRPLAGGRRALGSPHGVTKVKASIPFRIS